MKITHGIFIGVLAIVLLTGGYFLGRNAGNTDTSVLTVSTSTDIVTTEIAGTTTGTTMKPSVKSSAVTSASPNYIRMGQKVLINGIFVMPAKVSYDGRCPKDVKCVQAGSFDLAVILEKGTLSQNVIITSGKPFAFGGKTVTLTTVSPSRVSTKTIAENEYRFLFNVK